jgi:hypothetical protein
MGSCDNEILGFCEIAEMVKRESYPAVIGVVDIGLYCWQDMVQKYCRSSVQPINSQN